MSATRKNQIVVGTALRGGKWKLYGFAAGIVLAGGLFLLFQPFQKEFAEHDAEGQVNFRVDVMGCRPAYVNMYTVRMNPSLNEFEVINAETRPTNNASTVYFRVAPEQMVYFEAYRIPQVAQNAAQQRRGYRFSNPPPFKNFRRGSNILCQTNYPNVNQPLGNNWNNACRNSLSIPCIQ